LCLPSHTPRPPPQWETLAAAGAAQQTCQPAGNHDFAVWHYSTCSEILVFQTCQQVALHAFLLHCTQYLWLHPYYNSMWPGDPICADAPPPAGCDGWPCHMSSHPGYHTPAGGDSSNWSGWLSIKIMTGRQLRRSLNSLTFSLASISTTLPWNVCWHHSSCDRDSQGLYTTSSKCTTSCLTEPFIRWLPLPINTLLQTQMCQATHQVHCILLDGPLALLSGRPQA
jgi:hypothetical protein